MGLMDTYRQVYQGGSGGGGGYSGSGDLDNFNTLRGQIAARNQALLGSQGYDYPYTNQQNAGFWNDYVNDYARANNRDFYDRDTRGSFSMSGGTKGLYNNRYRKANALDTAAIKAGEAADWWMNLPSNIAGAAGNDQLAQDLKFDASKFDLSNGLDTEDVNQVRNFALSLPGMIPGGLFEGVEKGYEAITGTPVQENRRRSDGTYEVADYQLDASQRAAAGIDALIDIGGTFTGGSAKALQWVGKGFGRAAASKAAKGVEAAFSGQEAQSLKMLNEAKKQKERADRLDKFASNMGKGVFEKAGFKHGKGAQFAYNVGEEAGEEYVQSYMEDIRNKELNENSFDKAVQSAAWGAVGGGMMHAGGALMNNFVHGDYDAKHAGGDGVGTDPADAIEAGESRYRAFEKYDDRNNAYRGGEYTDAMYRAGRERQKTPEDIAASGSAYGTMYDDNLDITKIRLSLGALDGMVQTRDDGETLAGLAAAFKTDVETINKISKIRDDDIRLAAWQDLLNKAGNVRIVAGRNPDTNGVGVAYVDVASIEKGHGVMLNSLAWKMLGGDVDGDRYQTYLHPDGKIHADGYLTYSFVDPMGHSMLNEDYVKWLPQDPANKPEEAAKLDSRCKEIEEYLSSLEEKYGFEVLNSEQRKYFVNMFRDAFNGKIRDGKNVRNVKQIDAVAWSLSRLQNTLRGALSNKPGTDRYTADRIVGGLMQDLNANATATASTYDEVRQSLGLDAAERLGIVAEDQKFLRSGDNKGNVDFATFAGIFGYKTGINLGINLGNPIMRQSGMLRFESLRDVDIWFDGNDTNVDVHDRFADLIAFSFALESIGADVENSIEGVFWTSVFDSTLTRYMAGKDGHVDISADFSLFLDILQQEYRSKAKDFNEVLQRPSTVGNVSVKIGALKNEGLADDTIGLSQIFRKTFGFCTIDSLITMPPNHPYRGLTINQIASEYALGDDVLMPFGEHEAFNKFFKSVVKDVGSNFRALESSYRGTIEQAASLLSEYGMTDVSSLISITRDNEGNIVDVAWTAQDVPAVRFAVNTAHYLFGEDVCAALGIERDLSFLTSRWGQDFMSGDPDRMLNAIFSAKTTYLYNNVINLATARQEGWESEVENELVRLQSEGGFFESMVYAAWHEYGNLDILYRLTDLDVTYAEKEKMWEQLRQNSNGIGGLFAEMLATPNPELGTSAFTKKITDAKRSMIEVRRRSNKHNRKVLGNVENMALSSQEKVTALKHFMGHGYTTMSRNAMAAFIYSQKKVVKGMVDKGIAPSTSDIMFQMTERMQDGQLFSYLEGLDYGFGNMYIGDLQTNRVQLCRILSDPKQEVRVYSRSRNGYLTINREAIFREVLGDSYKSYDLDRDWTPWKMLFERCPALVSIVAPTHIGTKSEKGVASVQEGYAKTLDEAMKDYERDARTVTKQYENEQRENEMLEIAMRDPNWWAALVAEGGFAQANTLAEASDMLDAAIKRHLRWFHMYAASPTGGDSYIRRCQAIGDEAARKAWDHVAGLDRSRRLAEYLRETIGTVDSSIYGSMAHSSMDFVVDTGFTAYLGQLGLGVSDGALVPIEQANMPTLQETLMKMMGMTTEQFEFMSEDELMGVMSDTVQTHMNIMFIMSNMVDTGLFHYEQMYDAFGRFNELRQMLADYRKTAEDTTLTEEDRKKINENADAIEKALDTWQSGSLGGISSMLFGRDVFSDASKEFSPYVIPNDAVDTWTEEQFKEAVHKICDDYNFNESRGKIDSAIHSAFDKENNKNWREEITNLKNYFNQIILTYELNKITPGGATVNHLAPKQTIEAYRTMIAVGERIKAEMGDRLEPVTGHMPQLNFNYEDTVASTMSAHMAMNAASGAITTGIGLDGGMLPCLAGFGLLDTLECSAVPVQVEAGQLTDDNIGQSFTYTDPQTQKEVSGHIRSSVDVRNMNRLGVVVNTYPQSGCAYGGCSKCAPMAENPAQTYGHSENRHSMIGRTVAHLINWMQEPRHLRAKKALGEITPFGGPRSINKDLQRVYTADEVLDGVNRPMSARETILKALNMRRDALRDNLHNAFRMPEVAEELHFDEGDERESTMFSALMTNFVEVTVPGPNGGTFIVSVNDLISDEAFEAKVSEGGYDFGSGPGVLPGNAMFNPVVMSLQEVAESVTRSVASQYYAARDNGDKVTVEMIRKWANGSMSSWEDYNSQPITMGEFLDGIVANPPIVDMPMLADGEPSTRMLWNDAQMRHLSATFSRPGGESVRYMTDNSWKQVRAFNDAIGREIYPSDESVVFGGGSWLANSKIVAVHGSNHDTELGRMFGSILKTSPLPDDTGTSMNFVDNAAGNKTFELREIYIGTSAEEATDAYYAAANNGRDILVPSTVFTGMSRITRIEKGGTVDIAGTTFVVIHPRMRKYLESFRKQNMTIATAEMDPDDIFCAMESRDKLGAADASHYTHPEYHANKLFRQQVEIAPTKLLDYGRNPVYLMDDASRLKSVSIADVDFSYYQRNNVRNRNIGTEEGIDNEPEAQSYRDAVARYLNLVKQPSFDPRVLSDVKQGDCIGLVAQADWAGHIRYAPIFYEGTVAHVADHVVISRGEYGSVQYVASSSKVDYNGNDDVKLDLYGVAYKTVGRTASPDILKKWGVIVDGGFNVFQRPDHMFDGMSIGSRLVEMGDRILHGNIYFYTRKAGVNAFFTRKGDNWEKRGDLNAGLKDRTIVDLCAGVEEAWAQVADGTIEIYADPMQNARMQRATQDILALGGFPHLMFNSARVEFVVDSETGVYSPKFIGRERRFMDPNAVFKNWNTDDFLALWNGIDSRLCPATLKDTSVNDDGTEKVFDAMGRMLDYNTISGKPERMITIIGPHFYTSREGNAISDLSRGAAYSPQHILQDLLRSGVYAPNIRNTMEALSVGVGNMDSVFREETLEEELDEWRRKRGDITYQVRRDTLEAAQQAIKDPLFLSLIQTRRDNFIKIVEDYDDPLPIVVSRKDNKSAFDDAIKARDIENLVEGLNNALACGRASRAPKLSTAEVVMLVRSMTGTTTHTNLGVTTITFDQFKYAVEEMTKHVRDGNLPIMGELLGGRSGDRVSIPLLPRGLTVRLSTTNFYQDRYPDGNIDAIIDEQYDQLLTGSIDAIKALKDPSKRKALYQMADAMCYVNGKDPVSGNIIGDVYMNDLISAARDFSFSLTEYDPELFAKYDEHCKISKEWANKVAQSELLRRTSRVDLGDGNYQLLETGDPRNIMVYTMRQMAAARKAIGLTYIEMPLSNCLDRAVGQTGLSWALGLGRKGVGPYTVKEQLNQDLRETTPKRQDLREFWSALREAQLYGVERTLLTNLYNGVDLQTAIRETLREQGAIERFNNKVMNIASGKDWGIEKQIEIFLDRFWQRSETEAPWWHMKMPGDAQGRSVFEVRMETDPVGLVIDLLSGSGEGRAADALLARQCMQFALAGDMSQKNLVSAVYSEIAKRSALADFGMTTFVSPYFQYATNRLGRVLNAVSPVSSICYLATDFFAQGPGADMKVLGTNATFGDLGLDEYQVKANLKEAIYCDMIHMGGTLVAMTIAGLALSMPGVLEPPDDPDKRGNFEEWTFFGMRINANWWIEDSLGIALPLATFMVSAMNGEPRIDLIVNGAAHYLSSNPLVKVADVVSVLFDPMGELYSDYENDVEGYAKAMGGPPDIYTVAKGKTTSFGLTYVSQFITPGFLRELYQAGQGNEVAYKRIFQTDKTGMLTLDAKQNNATQYTTYEDAILRKYTKDNPVMGFLADVLFRPQTGYMNHEMPDRVIYDPEMMNSIEAFSMYEDPYTKKIEKSASEKFVTAQMVISALEANSVEDLVSQGFMIDYDTKVVVGQVIWDMIASENDQWAQLEQSGALSYYNAGYGSYDDNVRVISEMRQTHYNYINYLKDLYNKKLWSDELKTVPTYNQRDTEWAQDVNGNWYATGFESSTILSPIKIAPGESPDFPQSTMSRENDWQTQSYVTGNPTGQRALIPRPGAYEAGTIEKPTLKAYSEDGTETGHSKLYNEVLSEMSGSGSGTDSANNNSRGGFGYPRYGGGGGGYRRPGGGGGGGGRGYVPSASGPNVNSPTNIGGSRETLSKASPSRIMNTDRLVEADEQYLRPDFETKGSREAYKRSDI